LNAVAKLMVIFVHSHTEITAPSPVEFPFAALCVLLVYSAQIYIGTALCVGRLHDMDLSGWHCVWLLPMLCVFFYNWPAGGCPLPDGWRCLAVLLYIAGVIASVAFNLMLVFRQGTPGRNRFGERTQIFRDMFRRSAP
jgi:uncharacterized membrane protein YhaH (DUF805 family)